MTTDEKVPLERRREQMERTLRWTAPLTRSLEREGFALASVHNPVGATWFVRAMPPPPLQDGLGLAPEVLVVAAEGEIRARDLHEAHAEVVRSGLRLDGNLVIVADEAEGSLASRLDRIGGHGQRIAWVRDPDGAWPSLPEVLRESLPRFDAFEERDAVRGAQFVGRTSELSALRTRVMRGDAVGLFGLRKMGKTSVVRAVTDWFDPASGLREASMNGGPEGPGVAVVVDASALIERNVDAVADELREALRRRMRAAGEAMPTVERAGLVGWKAVGEELLERDRPLCVVIDEYDLLFEGESGEGPVPGVGKLFRLLRAWAQTRQGRVSLVLVGRDPTHLEAPEIDGVTSALTAWCTPMWLGPLDPPMAQRLLCRLGRRVGLDVGSASVAEALRWTGGHPLLQRQYGSALQLATREQDDTWGAPTGPHTRRATSDFVAREAVLDVMREVVALLRKRYPQALDALLLRAHGVAWPDALAEHGGVMGATARCLRNFGLVDSQHALPEGLKWYLHHSPQFVPTLRKTG